MDVPPSSAPPGGAPASAGAPDSGSEFVRLYAGAGPTLFAWAHLRLRSGLHAWMEPEDMVQEICFRAYDRFTTFDAGKGSFRRWLFGIANNVLREALDTFARRGQGRMKPPGWSESPVSHLPDDATSVSRRAAKDEGLRVFAEKIADLADEEKRLFIYRGLEGFSHSETAELLGTSRDAVEKRWQRLLAKLEGWRPPADLF